MEETEDQVDRLGVTADPEVVVLLATAEQVAQVDLVPAWVKITPTLQTVTVAGVLAGLLTELAA